MASKQPKQNKKRYIQYTGMENTSVINALKKVFPIITKYIQIGYIHTARS